jgi:5'(3')-deoxyribonucleotidase
MKKKILYIDMDGVVANFDAKIREHLPNLDDHDDEVASQMVDDMCDKNPTIFEGLEPIKGAIESVNLLFELFDVFFLSTPMWSVPESFMGKRIWIEKHFGEKAKKRLILTHRKDLNIGDYLIDDRLKNGAGEFTGELLHFKTRKFPTWDSVVTYLTKETKKINTMSNIKELIAQVKDNAEKELSHCNAVDTPSVCQMIQDAKGKEMIIDLIVEYVGKNGMTIGEAINYIERDNNPQLSN